MSEQGTNGVKAALARWAGKPNVPALDRLRGLAQDVDAKIEDLQDLEHKLAAAFSNGGEAAHGTQELAAAIARARVEIAGMEQAVPAIEDRIRAELRTQYDDRLKEIHAELHEAGHALKAEHDKWAAARAALFDAEREVGRCQHRIHGLQDDVSRTREKLAQLG